MCLAFIGDVTLGDCECMPDSAGLPKYVQYI